MISNRIFYAQLDGLGIIAAFGVINLHWLSSNYLSLLGIDEHYDWGICQLGCAIIFYPFGFSHY